MRTATEQLIDLAKVFNTEVMLTKDVNGKFLVWVHRVCSKENRKSCIISGISGRSEHSIEEACKDFLSNAKGKLLVGDDRSFYGENRPEYICV